MGIIGSQRHENITSIGREHQEQKRGDLQFCKTLKINIKVVYACPSRT
jgi:hypothetical protein